LVSSPACTTCSPKVTGYAYSDLLGRIHFWLSFIGINAMYVPLTLVVTGMARGTGNAPDAVAAFYYWHLASSIGAYVFAAGFLVFFVNMALSFRRRRRAG
jgi:cytochrome c oxidase subunit 1